MNNLIELFGNHIYKTAPTNPLSARKKLCFAFSTAGLMCKYFPTKKLFTPIYAVGGCRFCNHTAENGQKFCNRKSVSAVRNSAFHGHQHAVPGGSCLLFGCRKVGAGVHRHGGAKFCFANDVLLSQGFHRNGGNRSFAKT